MNNYHDVQSWSTQYREERLREAETRRLEARLRDNHQGLSWWRRAGLALTDALALLGAESLSDASRTR